MRPVVYTATETGNGTPVVVDYLVAPFNVGLQVSSTATNAWDADVQITLDDPWAAYATSYSVDGTWLDHATLTSLSVNAIGAQTTPVRAVRLKVNTLTDGDTVNLTVVQATMG